MEVELLISRRSVLAGLAGASLTNSSVYAAATSGKPDVLVIGAGLSGLRSAMLLEEAGASVQVLEGRERIGGRLFTRFDLPGHPEVGGNTIASGYARIIDMAQQLDVELIDYAPRLFSGPAPELVLAGQLITENNWSTSPLNPLPVPHRALLPWQITRTRLAGTNPLKASSDWLSPEHRALDQPLDKYMQALGLSEPEIRLGYDTNPYYGDSSASVSALMYLFNEKWTAEQGDIGPSAYAVAGGNQRLPQAMAATLKNEVRLNHEVTAIEVMKDRARVHIKDGAPIDAGQVICSLPVSKLRDISILPRMEGPQRRLVSGLRYMRNSLVFLVPREPFWEKDGLSPSMWTDGPAGVIVGQRFGDNPKEVTGLVANARGWRADYLDRLGADAAGAAVIQEIERLRPAAKGALEFGGFHSWWQDPFSAGDWAIFAPGQISDGLPQLADSLGRLHFCGEHTGQANRGMEAAMESAERAVIRAFDYL